MNEINIQNKVYIYIRYLRIYSAFIKFALYTQCLLSYWVVGGESGYFSRCP